MAGTQHVQARIDQLADDVGRLRRRAEPDSSLWWLADRLAVNLDCLDAMLNVPASEVARWYVPAGAPGFDAAVDEAIRLVDERHDALHARMGTVAARRRLFDARLGLDEEAA